MAKQVVKDGPPEPVRAEEPPVPRPARETVPMEIAPRDGRWIEVTEDGEAWAFVRFYQTRMREAGSVAWVQAECWSTSDPSRYGSRVANPVGWRPLDEESRERLERRRLERRL